MRVLVVVHSPDEAAIGRRFILGKNQTLFFGRDVPSGLKIHDNRMSKQHFLIVAKRAHIECADVGSTNGTFVDARAVSTASLSSGSVIRAGDTLFVVSQQPSFGDVDPQASKLAETTFPVLLHGETGTGKEVMARRLHRESRRKGPFVPVNCATVSRELVAAELFGHVKGAFSGATSARPGLFRAAHTGTLFLDEIGDLPLSLQPALLRVLEDHHIRPVGSDQEVPVDVRIICATHIDLLAAVGQERFREDLYARISRVVLTLPPLRARREVILDLAREFSAGARLTANAAEALLLWNYPRNVRELKGWVEVATKLSQKSGSIRLADLGQLSAELVEPIQARRNNRDSHSKPPEGPMESQSLVARRAQLQDLLLSTGGNISQVAEQLGKPRAQIYRWAKSLGLEASRFRK
jgi:transcriptional regulator with GAF, ATPase, and Fis domain